MSLTVQTLSGTDDKESSGLMDSVQSSKMQVATVQQISRSSFPDQLVHDQRIVDFASGDDHDRWNIAAKIEQGVQFHRRFATTKLSPGKERQTQIDGCRVQSIDRLLQF